MMKQKILILTVLLMSVLGLSAQKCSCHSTVVNITAGPPSDLSFEGGIMGNIFGAFAGVKTYQTVNATSKGAQISVLNVSPYLRGTMKFMETEVFHAYLTGYAGPKIGGAGLRLGLLISGELMLVCDAGYCVEAGKMISGGFSVRF